MAGSVPLAVPNTSAAPVGRDTNYTVPLVILTSLFFMWGFLTCLNDILSPHLKATFDLNYFQAGFVQSAFFAAYFVMSVPAGFVVRRAGYKGGIIIGLLVAALGCVLFYPAASARLFSLYLVALFVLASGITLLQVAANPFVAVLGRPETASSRLTLTQAFNSLGTTIAPWFGSILILKTIEDLKTTVPAGSEAFRIAEAASVQTPYLGLAAVLVALAIAMRIFRLPKIDGANVEGGEARATDDALHKSAWSYRHLVLGAIGIFVYVGAEVAIGNYLVNYFKEPYIGNMSEAEGAKYVAYYWGAAMVGRFVGSLFTLRTYNPGKVLVWHAVFAFVLVVITMLTTGSAAMWSILAVGFFNSIMFPTIFTQAIDGLGKHTSQASGILCMAIVGGAIIPPLQGAIADGIGIHYCFILAAACYLYVAWYGYKGHIPVKKIAPASA